jgi:hypothetical protein
MYGRLPFGKVILRFVQTGRVQSCEVAFVARADNWHSGFASVEVPPESVHILGRAATSASCMGCISQPSEPSLGSSDPSDRSLA